MSRIRFFGLLVLAVLIGAFASELFDNRPVGIALVFAAIAIAVVAVMRGLGSVK